MRVVAAVVAVIIGGLMLVLYRVIGTNMFNMGGVLFNTLGWMGLGAALISGLFLTADCLSEEKREGTIGFLFLTDLRGYDVVAGKFIAHSMRAFYGLLAIFPVLAMIMLMGGVTGEQFWRTNLALLNALICSLVAGVFISSISRDAQKALAGTFFLVTVIVALGPIVDSLFGTYPLVFSITSPFYLFKIAGIPKANFWTGLLVCQFVAALLFIATCVLLPRKWESSDRDEAGSPWSRYWRYGSVRRQRVLRQKLMERSPVLWLVGRERWQSLWLWIGVCFGGLILGWLMMEMRAGQPSIWLTTSWSYLNRLVTWFTYFWVASHATRFFFDSKKTGFIELLLATPLGVGEIVRGHWLGFVRMFALPVLLLVTLDIIEQPALQQASYARIAALSKARASTSSQQPAVTNSAGVVVSKRTKSTGTTTTTTTTVNVGATTFSGWPLWVSVLTAIAGAMSYLTNLAALSWFGGWMGVTSKKANLAILKTITFVMLMPWFCINVAGGIIAMVIILPASGIFTSGKAAATITSYMVWFPLVTVGITTVLTILKDVFFIRWARRKLYGSLRETATQAFDVTIAPPVMVRPPPLPLS